jgi:hypothetical protein
MGNGNGKKGMETHRRRRGREGRKEEISRRMKGGRAGSGGGCGEVTLTIYALADSDDLPAEARGKVGGGEQHNRIR